MLGGSFLVLTLGVVLVGAYTNPYPREIRNATCVVSNRRVQGIITLTQDGENAPVYVSGWVTGLSPGLHGFHCHRFGDLSGGCASAGCHYNPFGRQHGAPYDYERHVGDLGNILANRNGVASISILDSQLNLYGRYSILGRALVVHKGEDDLGRGGSSTGNAGPRAGCCVIGIADVR